MQCTIAQGEDVMNRTLFAEETATHILVKHIIKDFIFPAEPLRIYMPGRILRGARFLESVVLHLSRQSLTAE